MIIDSIKEKIIRAATIFCHDYHHLEKEKQDQITEWAYAFLEAFIETGVFDLRHKQLVDNAFSAYRRTLKKELESGEFSEELENKAKIALANVIIEGHGFIKDNEK